MCKVGSGGRFASPSFPGLSGVFATIVLYSNDLPSDNVTGLFWLYSNILYISMTISRSSVSSINVLLIFEMHDLYRALFLKATSFPALLFSFAAAAKRSIVLLQQYMHHHSNRDMILTLKF